MFNHARMRDFTLSISKSSSSSICLHSNIKHYLQAPNVSLMLLLLLLLHRSVKKRYN